MLFYKKIISVNEWTKKVCVNVSVHHKLWGSFVDPIHPLITLNIHVKFNHWSVVLCNYYAHMKEVIWMWKYIQWQDDALRILDYSMLHHNWISSVFSLLCSFLAGPEGGCAAARYQGTFGRTQETRSSIYFSHQL